jgi:hypothetical protein
MNGLMMLVYPSRRGSMVTRSNVDKMQFLSTLSDPLNWYADLFLVSFSTAFSLPASELATRILSIE